MRYKVIVQDKTLYIVEANSLAEAKNKFESGTTVDERFIDYEILEISELPIDDRKDAVQIAVEYLKDDQVVKTRNVSVKPLNINDYVQELLAGMFETIVERYELASGDMDMNTGAELVKIGDSLAKLLNEFIEDNQC